MRVTNRRAASCRGRGTAVLVSGVASASILAEDGSIYACVNNNTSVFRLIDVDEG